MSKRSEKIRVRHVLGQVKAQRGLDREDFFDNPDADQHQWRPKKHVTRLRNKYRRAEEKRRARREMNGEY